MRTGLGATAMAAGLLCTFDPPSAQAALYRFVGDLTPSQTLTQVYFVLGTGDCGNDVYSQKIADTVPGGVTTHYSVILDIPHRSSANEGQSIVGFYDEAHDAIAVTYSSVAAAAILAADPIPEWLGEGMPVYGPVVWDPGPPRHWDMGVGIENQGVTEADVAQYLHSGAPSGYDILQDFAGTLRFRAASTSETSMTFLDFSSPTLGGTATITEVPVPEPMALGLMVTPVVGLLTRRRRQR